MKYITMKQKNAIIRNYIVKLAAGLKKEQIKLESNKILELTAKYLDSNKDIIEIKEELDELVIKIKSSIEKLGKKEKKPSIIFNNNSIIPNFNYHTHTYRCGHAEFISDEEYVKNAIKVGITRLGFSEHSPSSNFENVEPNVRMPFNSVEEYINSISELKKKYKNEINIMCSFEAEYDVGKESFLRFLRDKTDYLILGQHFVRNISSENNVDYPIEYAKMVELAIESGLFDIVAHPDIYMMHRKTISKSKMSTFDKNAKEAAMAICLKAKEYDIPIEINLGKIDNDLEEDSEYLYPHSMFWKIAEMIGVKVIFAIDAHSPNKIMNLEKNIKAVTKKIKIDKLNFVDKEYNPKQARNDNKKIQDAYEKSQKKEIPYSQYFTDYSISTMMSEIKEKDFNPATLVGTLRNKIEKKQRLIEENIKEYIKNEELKLKETKNIVERTLGIERLSDIKSQQSTSIVIIDSLANNIYSSLTEAIYNGATTKNEIIKKTKKIISKKEIVPRTKVRKIKTVDEDKKDFTKVEKIDSIFDDTQNKTESMILPIVLFSLLIGILAIFTVTSYFINLK